MKTLYLLFTLSFGAAVATAASSSASASTPSYGQPAGVCTSENTDDESTSICPPNEYECCDGDAGTALYCASHGGRCGIISRCGIPV